MSRSWGIVHPGCRETNPPRSWSKAIDMGGVQELEAIGWMRQNDGALQADAVVLSDTAFTPITGTRVSRPIPPGCQSGLPPSPVSPMAMPTDDHRFDR
ncbi:MAG: hypothetical protein H7836_14930 [Magnetococcus sp. YQC-3]